MTPSRQLNPALLTQSFTSQPINKYKNTHDYDSEIGNTGNLFMHFSRHLWSFYYDRSLAYLLIGRPIRFTVNGLVSVRCNLCDAFRKLL